MTEPDANLDPDVLSGEECTSLKALIQNCVDLGRILREGATLIDRPGSPAGKLRETAGVLRTLASDAELLGVNLADRVATVEPDFSGESGSLSGFAHRAWLDVRSIMNLSDPYVVLLEVEKAHKRFVQALGDLCLSHARDPLGPTLLGLYGEADASQERVIALRVVSREPLAS